MNDRFKFRSWHEPTKTMEYNGLWTGRDWDKKLSDCNFKLMQCTGFKDKNGRHIYEGDIVKITKEKWDKEKFSLVYVICWDRTQWQLGLLKWQRPKAQPNRRSDRQFSFKSIVSFDDTTPVKSFAQCEVIGNIYENKELLNE